MTLKQLQAEWRPKQTDRKYWTGDDHTQNACADALAPHILQQERDMELLARIAIELSNSIPNTNACALYEEARSRLKEMAGER